MRGRLIAQAAARPDWVLGFQDETWWTRLARPDLFAWAGEQPLRLFPNERGGGKEALACYGAPRADTGAMMLRFVEGRPSRKSLRGVRSVAVVGADWRKRQVTPSARKRVTAYPSWDGRAEAQLIILEN